MVKRLQVSPTIVSKLGLYTAVALGFLAERQRAAGEGQWFTTTTQEAKDATGLSHFGWKRARERLVRSKIIQENDVYIVGARRIDYLVDLDRVREIEGE